MFRIHIYLSFYNFLKSFFLSSSTNSQKKEISRIILNQSKKKKLIFSSQCRIAFLYILKFLKKEKAKKNEIIFCAYNLPEMINVAKNLNYKVKFCDLNYESGFFDEKHLISLINKKTKIIVLTNMFNDLKQSIRLKKIAKKNKIVLIEDNAIYFDNFSFFKNKKKYSGSIGDYSIYSFNIMKNISGMYGGALVTDNHRFINYYENENKKNSPFLKLRYLKQIIIFFILKFMSNIVLYKIFFIKIIKFSHLKQINFLLKLFYPSLNFKIIKFPKYYFTKISNLTIKMVYLQIKDFKQREINFKNRKIKNIYYYKNISKIKNKKLNLIKTSDFNYQNYLDFPILINDKKKFNMFLLKRGIETKYIHYKNCESIFKKGSKCKNASLYEKRLICLPNHEKITFKYMDKIIKNITLYLQ